MVAKTGRELGANASPTDTSVTASWPASSGVEPEKTTVAEWRTKWQGELDHDQLTGFVAAEHIDWSVTGAEDIHDDRIAQSSVTQHQAAIDHDALTNFVANEHIDHSSVSITGANSLTGGGDLTASRTISLVGDATAPGSDKYYGTGSSGTKGFFDVANIGPPFNDDSSLLQDSNDTSSELRIDLAPIDTSTQRVWTAPNANIDFQKLVDIEANADVTDAANVDAAGAIMHTDVAEADGYVLKTAAETYEGVKINRNATQNPTATDDISEGYSVGSLWFDTTNDQVFLCVDDADGAAVWVEAAGGTGAPTGAQYLTLALNANLSAERVLTPGVGLVATDDGANGNYTLDVDVGIANNEILQVDAAAGAPADDEFARFTASGIEGRTPAEVRTDLNVDGALAALNIGDASTLRGENNITTLAYTLLSSDKGQVLTPQPNSAGGQIDITFPTPSSVGAVVGERFCVIHPIDGSSPIQFIADTGVGFRSQNDHQGWTQGQAPLWAGLSTAAADESHIEVWAIRTDRWMFIGPVRANSGDDLRFGALAAKDAVDTAGELKPFGREILTGGETHTITEDDHHRIIFASPGAGTPGDISITMDALANFTEGFRCWIVAFSQTATERVIVNAATGESFPSAGIPRTTLEPFAVDDTDGAWVGLETTAVRSVVEVSKPDPNVIMLWGDVRPNAADDLRAHDAEPSQAPSDSNPYTLPLTSRSAFNVEIPTHANDVEYVVPNTAPAGSKWQWQVGHTGNYLVIEGDVGSISPNMGLDTGGDSTESKRFIEDGTVIAEVTDNPGSAPVVKLYGAVDKEDVVSAGITVDGDRLGRIIRYTGSGHTFIVDAAPTAEEVAIENDGTGSITVTATGGTITTLKGGGAVALDKSATLRYFNGGASAKLLVET